MYKRHEDGLSGAVLIVLIAATTAVISPSFSDDAGMISIRCNAAVRVM